MIHNPNSLLPIVVFDETDDWNSVRQLCSEYLDQPGQGRLETALSANTKCVAVEHHYIDKDYRDTFSNFHSKRFSTPGSRCVRLHFFNRQVSPDELKEPANIQENYLGYSVIRPTRPNSIGRTLIDFKNYTGLGVYVCSCKEKVSLQGTELEVEGFPFISQDTDATVCAQSALWMMARYFSNQYTIYPESYPSQISNLVQDYAVGSRVVPADGLYTWQLAETLRRLGLSPITYSRAGFDPDTFRRILYTYVESGIPVLAVIPGHVVVLNGHSSDFSPLAAVTSPTFSSNFCNGITVNDDNHIPYQYISETSTTHNGINFADIKEVVVGLAEKVFLTAENFEKVVLNILDDPIVGIKKLSPELAKEPLILRMFLTTVKSYKKKVSSRGMGDPKVESTYRELPLPHFIWICELSTPEEYGKGNVLGEIIWDATRNARETEGWIAIHYPEVLLIDAGSSLNDPQKLLNFNLTLGNQPYSMYRSNLKEV